MLEAIINDKEWLLLFRDIQPEWMVWGGGHQLHRYSRSNKSSIHSSSATSNLENVK